MLLTGENINWQIRKLSESHLKWQKAFRKIVDELKPEAQAIDEAGERPPDEFVQKCGSCHLLAANIGPGPWLNGVTLPGGIRGEDYDYFQWVVCYVLSRRICSSNQIFSELITHQEIARWGAPGLNSGLLGGMSISIPTVLNFGKPELKARVSNISSPLTLPNTQVIKHVNAFRLYLKSFRVESAWHWLSLNLTPGQTLLKSRQLPAASRTDGLSTVSRSGLLPATLLTTLLLLFAQRRVSLCSLSNVMKTSKQRLSRLRTLPAPVLPTSSSIM